MNLILLEKINKLNDDIKSTKEYVDFINSKNELENNETAIKLSLKKDNLIMKYEDNLKYLDKNDPSILLLQKEIKKCIDELNDLEVSKNYKEKEKAINEIIDLINKEIFDI